MTSISTFSPSSNNISAFASEAARLPSLVQPTQSEQHSCGMKHDNLVILKNIVDGIEGVQVPHFIGLSTNKTVELLKKHQPSFFKDWKQLQELFQNLFDGPQNASRFLDQSEVVELLESLRSKIKCALSQEDFNTKWGLQHTNPKGFGW